MGAVAHMCLLSGFGRARLIDISYGPSVTQISQAVHKEKGPDSRRSNIIVLCLLKVHLSGVKERCGRNVIILLHSHRSPAMNYKSIHLSDIYLLSFFSRSALGQPLGYYGILGLQVF